MDYVIGSVAALITGNVTPNRPKLIRKALTPTKHQPSPNVTPKSELLEDRSIFLSPTLQKKKAIVKKSPKRIFQNPELDITEDSNGDSSLTSPNTNKVKKHLIEELEAIDKGKNKLLSQKSPKKMLEKSLDDESPKKKSKVVDSCDDNNKTPKKKKKNRNSELNVVENDNTDDLNGKVKNEPLDTPATSVRIEKRLKMKMQRRMSVVDIQSKEEELPNTIKSPNKQKNPGPSHNAIDLNKTEIQKVVNENKKYKKRKKKNKKSNLTDSVTLESKENIIDQNLTVTQIDIQNMKKNKKKMKNESKQAKQIDFNEKNEKEVEETEVEVQKDEMESESEEVKSKNLPNPNAITEKDSDSEHDSDNDINSDENEQDNSQILINKNDDQNQSSDEEEEKIKNKKNKKSIERNEVNGTVATEDEIKRTLFVGNVPFSSKCKKEIKKIFNKYGKIVTIRIRTIPVKDARVTPKLAVIKNELHPERTTVNVYVKYADAASVGKALVENNCILNNNHLRVSRSSTIGSEHDPRCAVFVGNLPFAVEDETLRNRFEKCGTIESVRIIRDKKTNAGKGFGYVNFSTKDAVELALAMTEEDLTIKNRILRVKRCTQSQSQGKRQGKPGDRGGKWGEQGRQGRDEGAARRIMYKRKQQDGGGDGPPNKKQNITQPIKEKKTRKEFVGTTAEKKKKHKFNKGLKKKKILSEILSKKP